MLDSGRIFSLISRFALVGITATFLYALLAMGLQSLFGQIFGQGALSLLAYAIAAVFSYCAHRIFTFASSGAYRLEIPRFVVLTLTGASISFALPAIVGNWMNLPMFVSVLGVCIVIPLINFVALDRWVFAKRNAGTG